MLLQLPLHLCFCFIFFCTDWKQRQSVNQGNFSGFLIHTCGIEASIDSKVKQQNTMPKQTQALVETLKISIAVRRMRTATIIPPLPSRRDKMKTWAIGSVSKDSQVNYSKCKSSSPSGALSYQVQHQLLSQAFPNSGSRKRSVGVQYLRYLSTCSQVPLPFIISTLYPSSICAPAVQALA